MGKHKRKRRDEAVFELSERIRALEKRVSRRHHHTNDDANEARSSRSHTVTTRSLSPSVRNGSPRRTSSSRTSSRNSRTRSPRRKRRRRRRSSESSYSSHHSSNELGGGTEEAEPHAATTTEPAQVTQGDSTLPPDVEELLGEEGKLSTSNSIELHESLVTRWSAILTGGLKDDMRATIMKKYEPPKNCKMLVPPKLNEEVAAAMNESGIKRDKRISDQQAILSAAITTIGGVLNDMIKLPSGSQHIEALSDSARLLCDLYHENSVTRRALILPGLNKDVKELIDQTPISEHLFGDKFQDKVNACKAVKKSGQELKNTPAKPKPVSKPKTNLNYRGPQRPQRPRPSGQKPRLPQANHQAKAAHRRYSPPRQRYQQRRRQERR